MGVWGIDGSGAPTIGEEKLKPLGLVCYDGTSNPVDGMLYHVYNDDRSFGVYLKTEEWDRVGEIYNTWKTKNRKEKLDKINERE